MEPNTPSREQLVEELHDLRSRVRHLERLNQDRERSEERFRALVQAAPLAVIFMDSEGAVTLWNPAAETIFGWSEPEVLGKPLPYVAETMWAEHVALRKRVLSGEAFSGLEVRRQNKGGWPIDLRVSAVPLRDSEGDVCGIMSLNEDITTRKRAEDALLKSEALFNKSQALGRIGSWELNLAANRLTWSDEVYRIFGLRSEAFVPSYDAFLETVHPDDRETVNAVFSESVREGRDSYEIEHRIVRPDNGEVRFVLEKCEHVKDDAGAIIRSIGMVQDVTDHRRSEAALRASEDRLTQALRAADAGAWEWNMRTNTAVWSDENYLVLGLEPGSVEARYEHWLDAVHPEDRAAADRLVTAAVQNRTDLDISFRVVWPDGSVHWINDRGKLVYDESGEPLGMYGIQIDITARKLAELAVVESESSYQEIFNGTKDAIFIHDPQTGGIEDVNQGMLDMFGCTREEALRLGIAELSLGTAPYDQRHAAEKLRRTLAEGPQTFEWMSRKRNGELFWSEIVLKGTLIGGRRRVLAVVRDMDERKRIQEALRQKEEYYRSLFENAMDIVTIMRPDGTILFESPSVERIVGYKPEELIGLNAFALIHPEDAASTRQLFERLVNNPGSLERAEFRFRHREGSWRILEAVGSNLLAVPAVGAVVANLRDVTDRREMEQRLRVSLQEKEILVREVHHRVKNNLQIILSLLNLQAETVQAPQVHEIFMVSKQRVKAIAMIHERLYSSGDLSSVGLSDYLKDLVHTIVQANRPDGSIAVQVDIPPIRLSVNTAVPCGLIVNELVTNSIKHAFAEGQKGHLKVEVRSAPENRLALLVEDDGRGLPEHIHLEDAKSLGLTIVRTLAKQLGGTVDVQRASGARFHVTFANKP